MSAAPDRYALFGHPVAHSVSPQIHAAFAQQAGQNLRYEKREIPLDGFAAAVADFFAGGGKGVNATLPFKGEAFACAGRITPRAEAASAVNTLWPADDGTLVGDNTDGVGFVRDLTINKGIAVTGKTVLLMGAGGAARGVLRPLLELAPARLHIANRTAARATELAEDPNVTGGGFDDWPDLRFDLIINATAAGHGGSAIAPPPTLLAPGCACYDLSYGDAAVPFLEWARRQGVARTLDGWGMLVEQAAESFFLWRGVKPDTGAVIAAGPASLR
ncbi:MAG TPA: shikimate dehydrogenase [Gammaproteobacteria bacterium]|nr:shikimate dehydrogenase [Gammaproteobacteria bacterium]